MRRVFLHQVGERRELGAVDADVDAVHGHGFGDDANRVHRGETLWVIANDGVVVSSSFADKCGGINSGRLPPIDVRSGVKCDATTSAHLVRLNA
jgi:hypothetical protein